MKKILSLLGALCLLAVAPVYANTYAEKTANISAGYINLDVSYPSGVSWNSPIYVHITNYSNIDITFEFDPGYGNVWIGDYSTYLLHSIDFAEGYDDFGSLAISNLPSGTYTITADGGSGNWNDELVHVYAN